MQLVDRTLAEHPEISTQRSTRNTALAVAGVVASFGAAVLVLVNFDALSDWFMSSNGRRSAFAPLTAPILLVFCLWGGGAAARYAIRGAHEFRRKATGHRLRTRLDTSINATAAAAQAYHQRFAARNPQQYVPLPQTRGSAKVHIKVWMVPEDKVAYVAVGYGKRYSKDFADTQRLPFISYTGNDYEALELVRRNGWFKPAPTAATNLVSGSSN
ncbi:MAG: hypothetical protein ACRDTU_17330 [Micromonosporaceae bacterium]